MDQATVMDRLGAIRKTVYLRLIVYGACVVASVGLCGLVAIILLDWLLQLPGAPRIVIVVVYTTGLVGAAFHWLWRPVRAPVTVDEVAGRLERHFANLDDRLSSTVSFVRSGTAGSPSLMRRVVQNTERMAADLPLEDVLTLRPIALRMVMLAVSTALVLGICSISPGWMQIGVYRYLDPFGDIEWPKDVSIQPGTGNLKAPLGESVTVRMRVTRGLHETLRGVVHLTDAEGESTAVAMRRDGDAFLADIDAVTTDLTYWFEAGDADTRRYPSRIVVVRRPVVADAKLIISPPPYATDRPTVEQHLGTEPVGVPVGGTVAVEVRSSKPVPIQGLASSNRATQASERRVGLWTANDLLIPLEVDRNDRRRLTGSFVVTEDTTFRIVLVDDEGLENRGAATHTLRAEPDRPPVVDLLRPRAAMEVTPRAVLQVVVRVEDDYGIETLDLEAETPASKPLYTVSLMEALVGGQDEVRVVKAAQWPWNLADVSLSPGDNVTLTAVARDRYPTDPAGGQVGRSSPARIRIISELEFENRVRDELAALEDRIRQAALDQAEILDRTAALRQNTDTPTPLTDVERAVAADLAAKEARLGRRLGDVVKRSRRLAQRMARNKVQDTAAIQRVDTLADSLAHISSVPMAAATSALSIARDRAEALKEQWYLTESASQQEEALNGLLALLREISRWSDFQSLVTRTRDVLDRQESISTATNRFANKSLGKPVDSLSPDEHSALNQIQRRQEQLTTEVEQLLARMRQQIEALLDSDPASAHAIERALREAGANDLTRHLRLAVAALSANRTAAAGLDQTAVEKAIRRMIHGLENRQDRELDELRKRVEEAEEALALILVEQRAVHAATSEARTTGSQPEAYGPLSQRQRLLKRNTWRLGEELSDVQRADGVARLVRQATTPMGLAQNALDRAAPEEAESAQADAIALLEEALEALVALNAAVRQESMRRSLAQIREGLEAILAAQRVVHEGICQLKAEVDHAGRIGRLEARAASKLSGDQSNVRSMIDAFRPDLRAVVVFDWALSRVARWMETVGEWLTRRKIDDELVMNADRIVRELERLVDAIKSTESLMIDSEFADQVGGGTGGRQQAAAQRPIPAVTELLVLRAMQAQINERTRGLAAKFDPQQATERQLRQLRELAEDQIEVQRLTEKVTERARGK